VLQSNRVRRFIKIGSLISLTLMLVGGPLFRASRSRAQGQQSPYDFMRTLDYPDQQNLRPVYGRISVTLNATGSNKKDKTTTEVNVSAHASMNFDKGGATYESSVNGLVTATTPPEPKDDCQRPLVSSWKWSGSNSQRQTGDDGTFSMIVSKQKRLAHFEPGGVFGDLSQTMVHQRTGSCTTQELPDSQFNGVLYRLPLHGSGGSPFTGAADRIESEGKSLDQVLGTNPYHTGTIEGIIESSWDGSGTSGSFKTAMLARVVGSLVEWNTSAAWRAIAKSDLGSGFNLDTDPDLYFPGSLDVSWSLSTPLKTKRQN